ncbi:SDR family NAD(P)-dependent oxidoreductase [Ramlibacter sp. AW1]|uniref:SDR family NAD(P)-dependent oxidoreductase n=2 Tax=Ramlibacter aurantiacus TaxID=2801330 RepID=A0A936ZGU0_9BURK|nr:SDR family NAD(P)-dependent oxidoreductase [Ramlibacter aurantiacus]
MARQLLHSKHELLCIARHPRPELEAEATALGVRCEQWAHDLARPDAVAARLEGWLMQRGDAGLASITLINNAAVIPPAAPLAEIPIRELSDALRVDLEAPLLLTSAFLRATAAWAVPRKVLNISSGLGRRAMGSQATYCAAKAGMDHFTRCLALEEARSSNGARVCSLAPGVIDTDMQVQLRSADVNAFPDRQGFVGLKQQGVLTAPDDAAARVLEFLARPDFGSQPVADVRA